MLIVTGDSHALALREGLELLEPPVRDILDRTFGSIVVGVIMAGFTVYEPFYRADTDSLLLLGRFGNRFAALTNSDGVIHRNDERRFAFSFGFHLFGLNHRLFGCGPMWDRFSTVADPSRQFLSVAVMTEIILHYGRYLIGFVEELTKLNVSFVMIGPPPVQRAFQEHIAEKMTAPGTVKLQELFWAVMGNAFDERRVPYVLAPDETMTDGVLRPDFRRIQAHDVNHGNNRFGAAIWNQVAARIAAGTLFQR